MVAPRTAARQLFAEVLQKARWPPSDGRRQRMGAPPGGEMRARLKLGLPAARAAPAQSSSAEASGSSAAWLMASGTFCAEMFKLENGFCSITQIHILRPRLGQLGDVVVQNHARRPEV